VRLRADLTQYDWPAFYAGKLRRDALRPKSHGSFGDANLCL